MLCSSEDQGQLTINKFFFFKETNIEGKKKPSGWINMDPEKDLMVDESPYESQLMVDRHL